MVRMLCRMRLWLLPRLAGSRSSHHAGRELAVIYLGSNHEFDVVAGYAHCNLTVLVLSFAAPDVVPVHLFDGAKHGIYDAPSMVLRFEPSEAGDVQAHHGEPWLAATSVVDSVGLGTDTRRHALAAYGVADSPSQVGGIRAEIAHAAAKPVQHRPQSIDVGYTAVRHDVTKYRPGAYVGYAVDLDLYRRIKVRDHSRGKLGIGHLI